MIRNENEYREAVTRLRKSKKRIETQKIQLEKMGLSPADVKGAIDPIQSFHLQLQEEVESYQRLKRREFDEILEPARPGPTLDFCADRARSDTTTVCRETRCQ